MFEVPTAKRVKRSRLFSGSFSSSSSSSSTAANKEKQDLDGPTSLQATNEQVENLDTKDSDAEMTDQSMEDTMPDDALQDLKAAYGFDYEFVDVQPQKDNNVQSTAQGHDENNTSREQTFEFNLFKPEPTPFPTQDDNPSESNSTTQGTTTTTKEPNTQKHYITIRSPTPETAHEPGSGSILKPRPHSHYFTSYRPPSIQQLLQNQYINIALSGAQIKILSAQKWQGTHLPWRIVHIKQNRQPSAPPIPNSAISHSQPQPQPITTTPNPKRKITRPSKKRRITIRKRQALRSQAQALQKHTAAKISEIDEAAQREKKTQRNREKKVKKKLREKEKKLLLSQQAVTLAGAGKNDAVDAMIT